MDHNDINNVVSRTHNHIFGGGFFFLMHHYCHVESLHSCGKNIFFFDFFSHFSFSRLVPYLYILGNPVSYYNNLASGQ